MDALKSSFVCVNRSHIRYGFRAGVKAIRYGVNIALIKTIVSSRDFVFTVAILNHFCSPNIRRTHPTWTVIMRLYASKKNNHEKKKKNIQKHPFIAVTIKTIILIPYLSSNLNTCHMKYGFCCYILPRQSSYFIRVSELGAASNRLNVLFVCLVGLLSQECGRPAKCAG